MTKAAEPSQAAELELQLTRSRRRAASMRRAAALRCAQKICALGHTSGIERHPCWLRRARNGEVNDMGRILVMIVSKSCRITNSFEISFFFLLPPLTSFNEPRLKPRDLQLGIAGLDCSTCGSDIQLASDSRIDPAIGMMSRAASQRASGFRRAEKPVAGAVRLTSN